MKTVYPYQTDELLLGEGKGYVLYNTYDENEDLWGFEKEYEKCLSLCSCLNLKLRWMRLQPNREDEFRWEVIDKVLELAKKYDKRVMLGLGSLVSTGGVQEGIRSLVPDWVYEAGAKYNDIDCANYKMGGKNVHRIPEWTDEIFREKLEKMVKAVAERYDGNPLIECFINFSNGNWGEFHHLDINMRPCIKENLYIDFRGKVLDMEFFRFFVDIFPKYFKKTPLALPTNTFDKEDELEEWVKYAIDKYGYGLKREGLISIPECTASMWYCEGKGPAFGEWQTAYGHYRADGRWNDRLVDKQIEDGKLTHYNLGYYGQGALLYMREQEPQIRYWANHMGYLYTVVKCEYSEAFQGEMNITIRNDGVGATYLTHRVFLYLCDENGERVDGFLTDIDLRTISGGEEKTFTITCPLLGGAKQSLVLCAVSEHGKEIPFRNEKAGNGGYLLTEDKKTRVHFDCQSRRNKPLPESYMGMDFLGGAWWTALCPERYIVSAYLDCYLEECEREIVLPKGKKLDSFSAYGVGSVTLETENGEICKVELKKTIEKFCTGFEKESGKIKLTLRSVGAAWAIKFSEFLYSNAK